MEATVVQSAAVRGTGCESVPRSPAKTSLDRIQKILQEGLTLEGGDPNALDIWYYMEGDQPLELPILGLSWSIDQPYQWAGAESKQ